jgi:hypothetical protein
MLNPLNNTAKRIFTAEDAEDFYKKYARLVFILFLNLFSSASSAVK